MTPRDVSADAMAIIGLMNLPKVGTATIHRILDALEAQDTAPRCLLEYDAGCLVTEALLSEEQADLFTSADQRVWRDGVEDQLSTDGLHLIPFNSERYPEYLRNKARTLAPPLIFAAGRAELLQHSGIAISGARNLSEIGRAVTETLARRIVERRFTIVSGGAKGTDTIAHEQAIQQDGKTVVVLAEGILTPRGQQVAQMASEHDITVVSTCLPDESWQSWRAMERNRHILGLSDRLIVVEAGSRGGSLAAGKDALKHGIDTWVVEHAEPPEAATGNALLLELGARAIPVSADGAVTIPPELFAIADWVVEEVRG